MNNVQITYTENTQNTIVKRFLFQTKTFITKNAIAMMAILLYAVLILSSLLADGLFLADLVSVGFIVFAFVVLKNTKPVIYSGRIRRSFKKRLRSS